MKLVRSIDFHSDDVGCFCHEAVARALAREFDEVQFGDRDLSHEKYRRAADFDESLAQSAWREFLRNGPTYEFSLPSGVSGRFARYRVEFDVPDSTPSEHVDQVRSFLTSLNLGAVRDDDSGEDPLR